MVTTVSSYCFTFKFKKGNNLWCIRCLWKLVRSLLLGIFMYIFFIQSLYCTCIICLKWSCTDITKIMVDFRRNKQRTNMPICFYALTFWNSHEKKHYQMAIVLAECCCVLESSLRKSYCGIFASWVGYFELSNWQLRRILFPILFQKPSSVDIEASDDIIVLLFPSLLDAPVIWLHNELIFFTYSLYKSFILWTVECVL